MGIDKREDSSLPQSDNVTVSQIILSAQDKLAKDFTARRHAVLGDAFSRYGVEPEKLFEYSLYEVSYLANAIANENPALFTEYIDWAKSIFESKGIPLSMLAKNLELIRESMVSGLPPETHRTINEYISKALDEIEGTTVSIKPFIDSDSEHGRLAEKYLAAVIAGDRPAANRLIMEAFSDGMPIHDIYLLVLQPVQYEIGRLWQTNRITVAQEHFASAMTQMIMSQMYYPHICNSEKTGRTLVAICAGGELHEIGIRMVADIFELAQWNVCLLGANMPMYDIVSSLIEYKADVLGISAAMASSVNKAQKIIETVKSSEVSETFIIVGGFAFNRDRKLWKLVGADGYAPDAQAALHISGNLAA